VPPPLVSHSIGHSSTNRWQHCQKSLYAIFSLGVPAEGFKPSILKLCDEYEHPSFTFFYRFAEFYQDKCDKKLKKYCYKKLPILTISATFANF
jgi:hypothetical protein